MGTKATLGLVLTFILLIVLASLASALPPKPSFNAGVSSVPLAFPIFSSENESSALALQIASALKMGGIVTIQERLYDLQNPRGLWLDGLNNTVPIRGFGAPASPQKVFAAVTENGVLIELHYNASYPVTGPSGHFLFADIHNSVAVMTTNGSARSLLTGIASSLGIVLDGNESLYEYFFGTDNSGDMHSATLFRPINGKPVEFGNQIAARAWSQNGTVDTLRLFPWMASAPALAADEASAFAEAASVANTTLNLTGHRLASWVSQYALDPRGYVFAYSFRFVFVLVRAVGIEIALVTVWADANTLSILLVDEGVIVPSGQHLLSPLNSLVYPMLIAGSAIFVLATFFLGRRRSESSLLTVLAAIGFPFYTLRKARALDHFARGQIYEYLRSHPGASFSDLREDLGLQNGSAAHHLMVLERMGFIVSHRSGRLKLFFRSDAPERIVARMLSPLQYDILDTLARGRFTQAELAKQLCVSKQRANYNIWTLRTKGLVVMSDDRHLRVTDKGTFLLRSVSAEYEALSQ